MADTNNTDQDQCPICGGATTDGNSCPDCRAVTKEIQCRFSFVPIIPIMVDDTVPNCFPLDKSRVVDHLDIYKWMLSTNPQMTVNATVTNHNLRRGLVKGGLLPSQYLQDYYAANWEHVVSMLLHWWLPVPESPEGMLA